MADNITPRAYLAVERGIARTFAVDFNHVHRRWLKPIIRAMREEDYDKALKLVDKLNLSPVYTRNRKRLKELTFAAFRFGASRLSNVRTMKSTPKTDPRLRKSIETLEPMVRRAEQWTKLAAIKAIQDAEATLTTKAEPILIRDFVSFLADNSKKAGLSSLQLTASLHTSRTAVYGYTLEAKFLAVETYQIVAVLDGRTSEICNVMNGKTFSVEHAYEQSVNVLAVENPDDLKQIAPFPTDPERLGKMTDGELQSAGWITPPFHFNCRSYIDAAVDTEQSRILTPNDAPGGSTVTPPPPPQDVQDLNEYLGIPKDTPRGETVANDGKEKGAFEALTDEAQRLVGSLREEHLKILEDTIPQISLTELLTIKVWLREGLEDIEIMEEFGLSKDELDSIIEYG